MKNHFVATSFCAAVLLVSGCKNIAPANVPQLIIEIDTSQKAFPEAEGYGAYAKGGRGGRVVYVTNLDDMGAGSFREAVTGSGARTVVFAVSGIINLNSLVIIEEPYLTIAGQTASGNGITLRSSGIYIKTHDVIVRHIRIRPGDGQNGHAFEDRDALTIGENSHNVIIDHVSASWAVDETMSTFYEPQYISIQWCLLSEALSNSVHPEGEHSKGILIGDNTINASVHHNLFAHINDRSPVQVKGGSNCDVVSNLVYDWGEYAFSFAINYVQEGVKINFINNHFKKGPSTTGNFFAENDIVLDSKLYLKDNTGNDELLNNFNANQENWFNSTPYLSRDPIGWPGNITILNLNDQWDAFLSNVGATLPDRDSVDQRIINEVNGGTGSIIDSQDDIGGYPDYPGIIMTASELNHYDSDRDGMPNAWEIDAGLDPANALDGNADADGDGYTNLEEYLNG